MLNLGRSKSIKYSEGIRRLKKSLSITHAGEKIRYRIYKYTLEFSEKNYIHVYM